MHKHVPPTRVTHHFSQTIVEQGPSPEIQTPPQDALKRHFEDDFGLAATNSIFMETENFFSFMFFFVFVAAFLSDSAEKNKEKKQRKKKEKKQRCEMCVGHGGEVPSTRERG